MRKLAALAVSFLVLATACREDTRGGASQSPRFTNAPPLVQAASLERFDACPELLGHLKDEATKRVGPYGLPTLMGMSGGAQVDGMATRGAAESAADSAAPAAPKSFSTTNVQEADVDEPDTVKTNGDHLFISRQDPQDGKPELVSVATDGGPKIVGRLALPEQMSYELLLAGDRLLALAQTSYGIMPMRGGPAVDMAIAPSGDPRAVVAVIDVSDPAAMKIERKVMLDGSYVSARLVDGVARIVLNTSSSSQLDFVAPAQPAPGAERTALEKNKDVIAKAKIDDLLPHFEVQDDSGKKIDDGALASCDTTYHPKAFSGFDSTTVVTVDPADPDPRDSTSVLGGAGIVYASTDNLYVATQHWPQARPVDIGDTAIGAPEQIQPATETALHRFDIRDANRAVYTASGEVKGTVLNQWSMSEHEGFLRVATTEDRFSNEGTSASSSFVTVFSATGPKLAQVGQVGNIGPDERIYGVRFIGDVGYVVTFKQIDPLHVIDLSTPTRPQVRGELEIPGYSAYLHPVGEGRLLGIGQEATTEGRPIGVLVSLFDVSNPDAPKRIDRIVIEQANTPVEHDHHAFTWWEPSSLALVPIDRYETGDVVCAAPDGARCEEPTAKAAPEQSAVAFRIDSNDLRETGRITHAKHVNPNEFTGSIQRTIVVGGTIFTLSSSGVMASALDGFDEGGFAKF